MPQVLVFGESLIDLIQTGEETPAGNPTYAACPGGSPYNAALALARQGIDVGYACPLSIDAYGDQLLARLADFGASYAYPARVANPSALAVVSFVEGQPAYQFYRQDVADRAVDRASLARIPRPDWVQIGGLALCPKTDAALWLDHMKALKQAGTKISLDPNVRAGFVEDRDAYQTVLSALCALATVVKLSDEDAEFLFPSADPIATLRDLGVPLVALTRGAQGAVLSDGTHREEIAAQRAEPLGDTVGAGDTFGAALLARLLQGETDLRALGTYAATAARLTCQQVGCLPPTAAETRSAVEGQSVANSV